MRFLTLIAALALSFTAYTTLARNKKGAAASALPEIREATVQRTIPGRRESGSFTVYRFVIIWKAQSPPTQIFFRPDAGTWLDVQCARKERRPMFAGSPDYMVVDVAMPFKNIKPGQELVLSPDREAHDLVPAAVKGMPVSSIYYTTADAPGRWKSVPVKVKKLPDIQGM